MTPNGDLHVGHMSGPYLAADVYKRWIEQDGARAHYVLSSDDNQSYVDTTARRLNLDPGFLIERSRREVMATLQSYAISIDAFGAQGADYGRYVTRYFKRLYDAGLVEVVDTQVLFDRQTSSYPVESFVSGGCPTCLAPTSGGICETCGHPNSCADLLGLDRERFELRVEPRLVLDLERFRPELDEYLNAMSTHRPALVRLIDRLLAKPLAPFVLSYRMDRGLPAGFAGLPEQKLNVWAEMYAAHYYFLEQVAGPLSPDDAYVQFLGFDNSYFYVFVHGALSIAARKCGQEWPAPSAFITNQFYFLESEKFSTSKGHLVWARDLRKEFSADATRLFLALYGPEYQEAAFFQREFAELTLALASRINELVCVFNSARLKPTRAAGSYPAQLVAALHLGRSLEHFSMGALARRLLNVVGYMSRELARGELDLLPYVPAALARGFAPLCPGYAAAIAARFSLAQPGGPELAQASLDADLPEFTVSA
jgi:methionyl-tRNA synthetase